MCGKGACNYHRWPECRCSPMVGGSHTDVRTGCAFCCGGLLLAQVSSSSVLRMSRRRGEVLSGVLFDYEVELQTTVFPLNSLVEMGHHSRPFMLEDGRIANSE